MSDEFPRRRGRPPVQRDPVFVPQEEAEITSADEQPSVEDMQNGRDVLAAMQDSADKSSWEPLDETTPRDGYEIAVCWREYDDAGNITRQLGRHVRWKMGRHFNGRRWEVGGGWVPADGMIPLPAAEPTHWLKPPTVSEDAETVEAA